MFREWERLRLRSSDYKNHRIFSLRYLHKELIPVSIKLKSTLDTSKARKIIRKAEKDLLQARVKAINNILDQVGRQIEECRAKLASIISAERLGECQDFINKVSEIRFIKVRQRQINKFNHLVTKKEGSITIANAVNNTQSITNVVCRQAQAPHNPTPAIAHLPPGEGSNSPLQQLVTFSQEVLVYPKLTVRQQVVILPWQLLTFLLGKEAVLSRQLFTLLWKVTVLPRPIVRHQAVILPQQLLTFLPGKEAILSWELYTFPQKMTALPRPLFSFPQGKKTIPPRLLLSCHIAREIAHLSPLAPPMQGKAITPHFR